MSTQDRTLAAVARSLPDAGRPRLSDEDEKHLAPVERRAALAYAEAELATERLRELTQALVSDGIPDAEILGDTSAVAHIEGLRELARKAEEEP